MNLAKITSRLIGTPYELGVMDCFMQIVEYLKAIEVAPDIDEYQGITLKTYKDLFLQDFQKAKSIMVQLMDEYFTSIEPKKAAPGDVALMKLRGNSSLPFLGIIAGNAIVIITTEDEGVTTYPLQYYKILRAWKCRR